VASTDALMQASWNLVNSLNDLNPLNALSQFISETALSENSLSP
jgi:hypothetical protein